MPKKACEPVVWCALKILKRGNVILVDQFSAGTSWKHLHQFCEFCDSSFKAAISHIHILWTMEFFVLLLPSPPCGQKNSHSPGVTTLSGRPWPSLGTAVSLPGLGPPGTWDCSTSHHSQLTCILKRQHTHTRSYSCLDCTDLSEWFHLPAQLDGCEKCLLLCSVFMASVRAALALVPLSKAV